MVGERILVAGEHRMLHAVLVRGRHAGPRAVVLCPGSAALDLGYLAGQRGARYACDYHWRELRGHARQQHGDVQWEAATPTSWSATGIVVPVPAGATTGNVVVTVAGVASNGVVFTTPAPHITGLSLGGPNCPCVASLSGPPQMGFVINGTGFGTSQGTSGSATLSGTPLTVVDWSTGTSITVQVPAGAQSGNIVVTQGKQSSNAVAFTVTTPFLGSNGSCTPQ